MNLIMDLPLRFASRQDYEEWRRLAEADEGRKEAGRTVSRYVVGTDWGHFRTDRYEGAVDVFTDKELARTEADALNESAFMTGPDGKLVHANPWKVYELVEVK